MSSITQKLKAVKAALKAWNLLAGGQRAFSVQVKEVDIRTQKASRQWYLKFHEVRMTFGFKENSVDQCIYLKVSGSKFLFLVLYVDDILLASMLHDTKTFLIRSFEMKDMGEKHMSLALSFYDFPEASISKA